MHPFPKYDIGKSNYEPSRQDLDPSANVDCLNVNYNYTLKPIKGSEFIQVLFVCITYQVVHVFCVTVL